MPVARTCRPADAAALGRRVCHPPAVGGPAAVTKIVKPTSINGTPQTSPRRASRAKGSKPPHNIKEWLTAPLDKPSDDWLPSAHERTECSLWTVPTSRTILALGVQIGGSARVSQEQDQSRKVMLNQHRL